MLSRIPAVKWAFTRLRSVPHSGNIDVTPVLADVSPATAKVIAADVTAQAASAHIIEISTGSARDDVEIARAAPSAEDDTAISVMVESPPAAPTDASGSDDRSGETPVEIEPVVVAKASVSTIETAAPDVPEPVICDDPAIEISTNVEAVDAELVAVDIVGGPVDAAQPVIGDDPLPTLPIEVGPVVTEDASPSSIDVESTPVDAPALGVNDDRSPDVIVDVEAAVDEPCVTSANSEVLAEPVPEDNFDGVPSPTAAVEVEPAPALVSPSGEDRSVSKVRARAAEPADRTALIRQRWAETGIRMWNPRLHGTGEATLNIQGSVGLLPPAPGETMPRYDKLEFKMLGGQIVCEGVIVEAPAQAGHRSFTRLAEPGKLDRVREPARELQAALT
ncbi:MAG: hypothetical protein HOQ20_08890 [Bradyrhizobium sp.]|nr:hypothetical protein [Bradyrhizobium sp.]